MTDQPMNRHQLAAFFHRCADALEERLFDARQANQIGDREADHAETIVNGARVLAETFEFNAGRMDYPMRNGQLEKRQ